MCSCALVLCTNILGCGGKTAILILLAIRCTYCMGTSFSLYQRKKRSTPYLTSKWFIQRAREISFYAVWCDNSAFHLTMLGDCNTELGLSGISCHHI